MSDPYKIEHTFDQYIKQARDECGQAQFKLGLDFDFLYILIL